MPRCDLDLRLALRVAATALFSVDQLCRLVESYRYSPIALAYACDEWSLSLKCLGSREICPLQSLLSAFGGVVNKPRPPCGGRHLRSSGKAAFRACRQGSHEASGALLEAMESLSTADCLERDTATH